MSEALKPPSRPLTTTEPRMIFPLVQFLRVRFFSSEMRFFFSAASPS